MKERKVARSTKENEIHQHFEKANKKQSVKNFKIFKFNRKKKNYNWENIHAETIGKECVRNGLMHRVIYVCYAAWCQQQPDNAHNTLHMHCSARRRLTTTPSVHHWSTPLSCDTARAACPRLGAQSGLPIFDFSPAMRRIQLVYRYCGCRGWEGGPGVRTGNPIFTPSPDLGAGRAGKTFPCIICALLMV